MKDFFKKLFGLTRQYDVPVDHTWSRDSMAKQKAVQESAEPAVIVDALEEALYPINSVQVPGAPCTKA